MDVVAKIKMILYDNKECLLWLGTHMAHKRNSFNVTILPYSVKHQRFLLSPSLPSNILLSNLTYSYDTIDEKLKKKRFQCTPNRHDNILYLIFKLNYIIFF